MDGGTIVVVAVAVGGGLSLALTITNIWLIVSYKRELDARADAQSALSTMTEHYDEQAFRLAQIQQTLTATQHQANVEAQELKSNDEKPVNPDLAADDVDSRVRRANELFASWNASDAAAKSASATSTPAVPAKATADVHGNPGG